LISIDTHDFQRGEVRFFEYRDPAGRKIRFLLGRDSTGQMRGAFNACQQCYMYHQGFWGPLGEIVCRYCRNRYRLEALETGRASCVPVRLPFEMKGRIAAIRRTDLERNGDLF
jgi:uncharacterized membrane protein